MRPFRESTMREGFSNRAGIEPGTGHLKTDHRLSRNFYKGIKGDSINVMLAASAMNFKRMMNICKKNFLALFFKLLQVFSDITSQQNI